MIRRNAQRVKKHTEQLGPQKQPIPKPLVATAWKPGQSGNPAGRPLGARARISEKLIADIADVWETYGSNVLRRLAAQDPATLAKIAYGLLPRDVFVSVQQQTPGGLDAEAWSTLRRVLDIIQASVPAGAEPTAVFETIETALRAEYAKPLNSS